MPLNKTQLQTDILALLNNSYSETENGAQVRIDFANSLGDLIDAYVKSARITVPSGVVLVSGTATNQSNPAPIVLNNVIS